MIRGMILRGSGGRVIFRSTIQIILIAIGVVTELLSRKFLSICCSWNAVLFMLLGLYLFCDPAIVHAEDGLKKRWLGSYVGHEIPGYEVVRSYAVSVRIWKSVDQVVEIENKQSLALDLVDQCKGRSLQGVGIVNLRMIVALGAVPGPSSSPETFISNGMYKEVYGDCVREVAPRAR